jgi:hypothetical protein
MGNNILAAPVPDPALIANSPNITAEVAPRLAIPFEGLPFLCPGMIGRTSRSN